MDYQVCADRKIQVRFADPYPRIELAISSVEVV